MCVLLIRMMWLLTLLTLGSVINAALPEIVEPGPNSGVILKEQARILITNCHLHTQKVFVKLNSREVCWRHVPTTSKLTGWAGLRGNREVLEHTEADTTGMLQQLQKFTVTQSELSGFRRRPKQFIAGLQTAAAVVWTIFKLGLSTVNALSLATVRHHVNKLQDEIPDIREQIYQQQEELQTIGQSLKGTILVVNSPNMLMNDMLLDIGSSVDSLAMGKIPPYLIPLSLVQNILSTTTRDVVTPLQAHLAHTLGSVVPIFVDPEAREVGFIINLPINAEVQTPSLVAYHDNNPDLYLAPNMHYQCPSKLFIRDNTDGICGLKAMPTDPLPNTNHALVPSHSESGWDCGRWLVG